MSLAPRFLRPGGFDPESEIAFKTLEECPFHLFRALHVRVSPPDPRHPDPAKLIMDWNRLQSITRILHSAKNDLPQVRLDFSGASNRSWFNIKGEPVCSHPDLSELRSDSDAKVSDLMLLIGALIPLRRAPSLTLQEPSRRLLDVDCLICLEDLEESAVKDCEWGDDIQDHGWDDEAWIDWLDCCGLRLHRLLHSLDTPVAPFLRMEQFASLTHFAKIKYEYLLSSCDLTYEDVQNTFNPLLHCAYVLSPRNIVEDDCVCSTIDYGNCSDEPPFHCPVERRSALWGHRLTDRSMEFSRRRARLRGAETSSNSPGPDQDSDSRTARRKVCEGVLKRIYPIKEWKRAVNATSSHERCEDNEDSAVDDDEIPNLSDCEKIAYDSCFCFGEGWIEAYPQGIRHDKQTVRKAIAINSCVCTLYMDDDKFGCLSDRKVRD